MFANDFELWIGYRFFSEDAFRWARRAAGNASTVVALDLADTKYQFATLIFHPAPMFIQLPELDAIELGGEHEEFVRIFDAGP